MPAAKQPAIFYHPDYEHGNPLICFDPSASKCPFATHNERFTTRAEAQACYEDYMKNFTVAKPLTSADPDPLQVPAGR